MFTGIVAEVGHVISLLPNQLTVGAGPILKGIVLGGSIAVNGVCLTATNLASDSFTVGLSPETLKRTNLSLLQNGTLVNLERPLGLGGELGGHLVQGHIDGTGKILRVSPETGGTIFRFEAADEIMRYIVEKGFIAVEGISLTVTAVGTGYFEVSVIDYSKSNTNLGYHKIGDTVNLEIDIMAKYVERFITAQRPGLTMEFLRENGF
jgi:riboflavin synthase